MSSMSFNTTITNTAAAAYKYFVNIIQVWFNSDFCVHRNEPSV